MRGLPKQCAELLLLTAVVSVSPVAAQWELHLFGGGGVGRIRTNLFPLDSRGEDQIISTRPTWMAGTVARHPLSAHLAFSTGLYWSFLSGHDEYWLRGHLGTEADRQIHYVCLPLLAQVESHGFHLAAGYRAGFAVYEHGTFVTYNEWMGFGQEDVTYTTDDLGLKRLDMGLVGELGYRLSNRIDLDLHYYYGVRDVKKHTDGILSPLMNEQLLFMIGWRIIPQSRPKAGGSEGSAPQDAQ